MPALLPSSGTTRLEKPAVVYVVENILNGKRYIGVTTKPLMHRFYAHINNKARKSSLTAAIEKYGKQAFQIKTLMKCATAHEAYEHEKRFIEVLRPEYNRTKGGDGALSINHRIKNRSLSALAEGRKQAAMRRKRPVISLTDGRRWPSIREAAAETGAREGEIGKSCRGLHRYVRGLRFAYDDPGLDIAAELARREGLQKYRKGFPKDRRTTDKRQRRGPVIEVISGYFFESVTAAAIATGRRPGQISWACRAKTKCRDGSIFRFAEEVR